VGGRIAVAWTDNVVTVHDLASGKTLEETSGYACALSPDGQWLAHEGPQFAVLLRRVGSKDPDKSLGHHNGRIVKLTFSADGNTLGSASFDHTAALWDVAGRKQPVILRGHRETINDLAFNPDGGWVITASNDFTARIWDALSGQSLATLPGAWFMVDAGWSPDGAFLAVGGDTSSISTSISLYRVTGRHVFQRLARHRHGVQCVAANPRVERIATGADDHVVIDWDLATTQPGTRWTGTDPEYVTALAYSPDGSLLATGTGYGTLWVRDAETGEVKARLAGHKVGIPALAFDPSGRRLASGDRNGRIVLWDLATQQPVQQLQVGPSWVWSIAFLNDGRKLVSEVSNGPVVLFDLRSGKPEKTITLPGGIRRFIADSARKRLIVAFNNGGLCSLSIPDLTPGHRLEHAHPGAIESLALSPDGRLLATGGADRRVVFRDPVTFEPLLAFPEWTAMVKDLAFTPSARRLAYVGADSDIALWDLSLLHEGLQAAGLAWDQPAPAVVPASGLATEGEHLRPAVPVIRPDNSALMDRALILESAGRTREAVPYLAKASAANPKETFLSLKVAALQAWFGQEKELAATRQRILSFAKATQEAMTAERAAKACSILPSTDKGEREVALALVRAGMKLGKVGDFDEWNLLALGMAEYRSGNDAAADEALRAAAQAGPNNPQITGTAAFYRALSLFRQGKKEEARKLAISAAAKMKPLPKDDNNPLADGDYHDDLIVWLAYKEAKAMIRFDEDPPPKGRNDKK
jgi:WD40 repeat protein